MGTAAGGSSEGLCVQSAMGRMERGGMGLDLHRISCSTSAFLVVLFFNLFLSRNRKHSFPSPGRSFTGINQCKFTLVNDADLQEL